MKKQRSLFSFYQSKNANSRNGYIHLYNPKKEGLGSYDVHYINGCKKDKSIKNHLNQRSFKRYAA
tara:strand:- start:600 stop:794 length:195 start_codon:yes stop_codon:yes gene_type:complete